MLVDRRRLYHSVLEDAGVRLPKPCGVRDGWRAGREPCSLGWRALSRKGGDDRASGAHRFRRFSARPAGTRRDSSPCLSWRWIHPDTDLGGHASRSTTYADTSPDAAGDTGCHTAPDTGRDASTHADESSRDSNDTSTNADRGTDTDTAGDPEPESYVSRLPDPVMGS